MKLLVTCVEKLDPDAQKEIFADEMAILMAIFNGSLAWIYQLKT